MTPIEQDYMKKWGAFYKNLYFGRKKPETQAQRDFLKHIKMRLGTNEHERAFLAWLDQAATYEKRQNRPPQKRTTIKRRPQKSRDDDAIAWMRKKPVSPPSLPKPVGKKRESDKPDYDKLSSGKAHGNKARRLRERQLDRWGRQTKR